MMSKLKDFFFFYIYIYLYVYMLEQCKATVSYMVMAWTVNNTVAHHINNKVDNKLVGGLTDPQMFLLYILQRADEAQVRVKETSVWIAACEPLDVSALHSSNTDKFCVQSMILYFRLGLRSPSE